jgi:hypothetical protein
MIENPQPAWLPVLLLAFPGIVFTAFALNRAIFPRDDQPLRTVPALAVAAVAFGNLSTGLAIASTSLVSVVTPGAFATGTIFASASRLTAFSGENLR